jgi:hypothetical protein
MDEGTVTAQNASFTVLESGQLNEAPGTLQAGATDTDPTADGMYTVSLYGGASDGTLTLDSNGDGGSPTSRTPVSLGQTASNSR